MKHRTIFVSIITLLLLVTPLAAQTTEFVYQGSLIDGGVAANGNYDFQFLLFDALSGGAQIGATIPKSNMPVAGGSFNVKLDFGQVFPGANRYLEIRVRLTGVPGFTILEPRQLINSTPYSVKSLNADNAATATNAVNATNAVTATNATNATNSAQLGGVAASGYVGTATTSFIRNQAGLQAATNFNISGNGFIGGNAGIGTTNPLTRLALSGGPQWTSNLWNGALSMSNASAIGWEANASGQRFGFGQSTGGLFFFRTNSAFGTTGSPVTYDMVITDTGSVQLPNNVVLAVGAQGNQVAFGSPNGETGMTITGPAATNRADVRFGNNTLKLFVGPVGTPPANGISIFSNGSVNASHDLFVNGSIGLGVLTEAGSIHLCINQGNEIATCSSSLRYKTDIAPYSDGLNILKRLRPITFNWKDGGLRDLGLGAEDVAAIEPLLVTYNKDGQVEGVKYDRIAVVLINAIKEQNARIETQQNEIAMLKTHICSQSPTAAFCTP